MNIHTASGKHRRTTMWLWSLPNGEKKNRKPCNPTAHRINSQWVQFICIAPTNMRSRATKKTECESKNADAVASKPQLRDLGNMLKILDFLSHVTGNSCGFLRHPSNHRQPVMCFISSRHFLKHPLPLFTLAGLLCVETVYLIEKVWRFNHECSRMGIIKAWGSHFLYLDKLIRFHPIFFTLKIPPRPVGPYKEISRCNLKQAVYLASLRCYYEISWWNTSSIWGIYFTCLTGKEAINKV